LGFLNHCGDQTIVYAAGTGVSWLATPRASLTGRYGFGLEVDRPPLPNFLTNGPTCPDDPLLEPLFEVRDIFGHSLNGEVGYQLVDAMSLRLGYEYARWRNDVSMHGGYLAAIVTW
jgi:hypothetical protein